MKASKLQAKVIWADGKSGRNGKSEKSSCYITLYEPYSITDHCSL